MNARLTYTHLARLERLPGTRQVPPNRIHIHELDQLTKALDEIDQLHDALATSQARIAHLELDGATAYECPHHFDCAGDCR